VVLLVAVLFMLSRAGRRMDRLAEQSRELVERARREFEPKQPPDQQA